MTVRVVVVGAGIAGLSAAFALRDAGAEVLIVEAATRIGGKLLVSDVGGIPVDAGAEAMLARAPEGVALARELGLDARLVHPAASSAALFVSGTVHRIPGATVLGVPTDLDAVRASGILSDDEVARIGSEPDEPGEPLGADTSVDDAVGSRMGSAVVQRLVEPLLGGVYAGRADVLSVRATMPAIAARLAGQASVLTATRAALAATPRRDGPVFATLSDGLGSLPAALAEASGARLRLGTPVRELSRTATGFRLLAGPVPDPTVLEADAVIVAVPAAKAAGILRATAPSAVADLAAIEYASTAIVTLAYLGEIGLPRGSSGVLVPAVEGLAVKALTYSSQKWPHLAGPVTVVRASLGRHRDEQVLQRDNAELVTVARGDLARIATVAAVPIDARVTRWGGALPQYAVGHLDRIRRIRAAVDAVPGLAVCGAAYDGVGVPSCIRTGRQAADRVRAHLGAARQSKQAPTQALTRSGDHG